jgi:hypothetical protein
VTERGTEEAGVGPCGLANVLLWAHVGPGDEDDAVGSTFSPSLNINISAIPWEYGITVHMKNNSKVLLNPQAFQKKKQQSAKSLNQNDFI